MKDVVYSRRWLTGFYLVFTVIYVALGILLLFVALGAAVSPTERSLAAAGGWAVGGLSWLTGAPGLWSYGKRYRYNEARIGEKSFSLRTPAGHCYDIPFASIRSISYHQNWRIREMVIGTDSNIYTFDANMCPKPAKTAALIAERSGRPLVRL